MGPKNQVLVGFKSHLEHPSSDSVAPPLSFPLMFVPFELSISL